MMIRGRPFSGAGCAAWAGAVCLSLGLGACGDEPSTSNRPPPEAETVGATIARYQTQTVVENLEHAWGLAELSNGDLLVTERPGRLRLVRQGQLVEEPVAGTPDVLVFGQGGLFDVATVARSDGQDRIFLSYAAGTEDANRLEVVSARYDGEGLVDTMVIFKANRDKPGGENFGGALLPLPDGSLLISVGDGGVFSEDAQGLMTHFGKVVRILPEGGVPSDNPFTESNEVTAEIWTFGHRNIQGLALDPATETVYASEHGPRGGDELNVLNAGHNYGWPAISYGRTEEGVAVSPYTEQEGMDQPLLYWTPAIAPAGLTIYDGAMFPDWQGDLLIAALAGRELRRLDLADGAVAGQQMLLTELEARVRDVSVGADGSIFVLTDEPSGKLLRMVPDAAP